MLNGIRKAYFVIFCLYMTKEPGEFPLVLYRCAGHGTVLAGESPVMDNLPSM